MAVYRRTALEQLRDGQDRIPSNQCGFSRHTTDSSHVSSPGTSTHMEMQRAQRRDQCRVDVSKAAHLLPASNDQGAARNWFVRERCTRYRLVIRVDLPQDHDERLAASAGRKLDSTSQ